MMREYMVARLGASKVFFRPASSCRMQPADQTSAFASYALPCSRAGCCGVSVSCSRVMPGAAVALSAAEPAGDSHVMSKPPQLPGPTHWPTCKLPGTGLAGRSPGRMDSWHWRPFDQWCRSWTQMQHADAARASVIALWGWRYTLTPQQPDLQQLGRHVVGGADHGVRLRPRLQQLLGNAEVACGREDRAEPSAHS